MTFSSAQIQDQVDAVMAIVGTGVLPPIVQAGHPVLRAEAAEFTGQLADAELAVLIEVMQKVMHAAPGVGLAAPQLGIGLQLAVLEDLYPVAETVADIRSREPLEFLAIINPRYTALGSETAAFYEGCLSMTGWQAVVERPARVQLDYTDAAGSARAAQYAGWQARIVQHETDHLGGILYIDKAHTRSLADGAEYAARWAQPGIELAQQGLRF
ncbi:peptide deformylase [Arthrobacter sp. 35W]|uniref:peptide deformylase n=1 Tax=Arthrobacter sp. 35W TaxID=1132441 RepID=UPI00040B582C|nr:peptide deformylase [Arthrobacter sp. 35W]